MAEAALTLASALIADAALCARHRPGFDHRHHRRLQQFRLLRRAHQPPLDLVLLDGNHAALVLSIRW